MADELLKRLMRYWNEKPSSLIFARLGEELYKAGKREEAIDILREGVAKYPGYITGYLVLSRCLFESNQIDEAEDVARLVNQIDPGNRRALRLLADISFRKRDLEASIGYLIDILTLEPTNVEIERELDKWREELQSAIIPPQPVEIEEKKEEEVVEKAPTPIDEIEALTRSVFEQTKPEITEKEKVEEQPAEAIETVETISIPASGAPETPSLEELSPISPAERITEEKMPPKTQKPEKLDLREELLDEELVKIDQILGEFEEKEKKPPEPETPKVSTPPPGTEESESELVIEEDSFSLGKSSEPAEKAKEGLELEGEEMVLGEEFRLSEEGDSGPLSGEDTSPLVSEELEDLSLTLSEDEGFIYRPSSEDENWGEIAEEVIEKLDELGKDEATGEIEEPPSQKPKLPITPTMAEIYASQGQFKKAYDIYMQLIVLTNNPEEKKRYEKRMNELKEHIPSDELP